MTMQEIDFTHCDPVRYAGERFHPQALAREEEAVEQARAAHARAQGALEEAQSAIAHGVPGWGPEELVQRRAALEAEALKLGAAEERVREVKSAEAAAERAAFEAHLAEQARQRAAQEAEEDRLVGELADDLAAFVRRFRSGGIVGTSRNAFDARVRRVAAAFSRLRRAEDNFDPRHDGELFAVLRHAIYWP